MLSRRARDPSPTIMPHPSDTRKTPRSTRKLLGQSSSRLKTIVSHSHQLQALTDVVHRHLDPQLVPHCEVANFRRDTLVLLAESPVWATRLRYHAPALVQQLRSERAFNGLTTVRVRVAPRAGARNTPITLRPVMSAETAALIRESASSITDPALKSSLLRLSRRAIKSPRSKD